MSEIKKYYSLIKNEKEAEIYIYGDITSWPGRESDVSAYTLSSQIAELGDVDTIKVYINSCGGEVAEGLAIYNVLKRNNAKVITFCDGFACSIASVIFAAGDERKMSSASLLMVHNAWMYTGGNADQLRKDADDLDTVTQASINAYLSIAAISEDEIKALMDAESWITPQEALSYGFATEITNEKANNVSQSARQSVFDAIMVKREPAPADVPVPTPAKPAKSEGENRVNYLKAFFDAFKEKE
jgi:ATP-dependent Clp protease, protease subunit